MSSFYLDILKDRLYVYRADSLERRSAQTALFEITLVLTKLLAPILAFTADEIWTFIPTFAGKEESVHLSAMAEVRPEYRDEDLAERWRRIMALKQEAAKVMEEARRDKVIGHPLDAEVTFKASGETLEFLRSVEAELKPTLIVSRVVVEAGNGPFIESAEFKDLAIEVAKAPGEKCPRCWNYSVAVAGGQAVCERCATQL
jgi:isoleucyl-tRNA synthetase